MTPPPVRLRLRALGLVILNDAVGPRALHGDVRLDGRHHHGVLTYPTCPTRGSAVRPSHQGYAGKLGYYDDDEGDRAVVYFGEPIHSGYVLIRRDYLANVTGLEHERWKRAHPEFCRKMGIP